MIEQFVKNLLKEKGLETVDPVIYSDLVDSMSLKANEFINDRLIAALNDQQLEELDNIIQTNPNNESVIKNYLDNTLPEKDIIAASALSEFRELYLGAK